MSTIFETATRNKTRFESIQGLLSVEQLWDLPLTTTSPNRTSLDAIALTIQEKLDNAPRKSFVSENQENVALDELKDKMEIILHIIKVKKEENAHKANAKAIATKKEELKALIESKKVEAMGSKSIDELEAELAALN